MSITTYIQSRIDHWEDLLMEACWAERQKTIPPGACQEVLLELKLLQEQLNKDSNGQ